MRIIEKIFIGSYVGLVHRRLIYATGILFSASIITYSYSFSLNWSWWQLILASIVSFDIPAGAVANNLVAVKRHWGRMRSHGNRWQKLLANRTNMALMHIPYILAMGYAFWDSSMMFTVIMCSILISSSLVVQSSSPARARAIAVSTVAVTMLVNIAFHPPTALWWFMPLLIVKVINGFTTPLRA